MRASALVGGVSGLLLVIIFDTGPYPYRTGFGEADGVSGTAVNRAEGSQARVGVNVTQ